MSKFRYGGCTGKYNNFTKKQLLEILKNIYIPNKSRLSRSDILTPHPKRLRRSKLIDIIESMDSEI